MNSDEDNGVEDPNSGGNLLHFLTLGPDGTNWLEPGSHWPGGYDLVQTWRDGRRMVFPAFEADGWGAGRVSAGGSDDRFAFAYYGDGIAGANDPSRNYKRPAVYTDASRTHLVYEAGWPTTIGVDFKLRVHQYTSNDQNMNDFVALEITMTNTGDVDINGDGSEYKILVLDQYDTNAALNLLTKASVGTVPEVHEYTLTWVGGGRVKVVGPPADPLPGVTPVEDEGNGSWLLKVYTLTDIIAVFPNAKFAHAFPDDPGLPNGVCLPTTLLVLGDSGWTRYASVLVRRVTLNA